MSDKDVLAQFRRLADTVGRIRFGELPKRSADIDAKIRRIGEEMRVTLETADERVDREALESIEASDWLKDRLVRDRANLAAEIRKLKRESTTGIIDNDVKAAQWNAAIEAAARVVSGEGEK